jgi:hypothetical protein
MAKMPTEVIELLSSREASIVMATVEEGGMPRIGVKGRLNAPDAETITFAEIGQVQSRGGLNPGQKVAFAAFKHPNHGYMIQGTFQGYQTSGQAFDQWAKQLKERLNVDLKQVGVVRVEAVYSSASENRSEHGKRIA